MSQIKVLTSAVFTGDQLRLFKPLLQRELIFCFVFCQLIWFALGSLDLVNNLIWPAVVVVSLIGSWLLCGNKRSYPFILVGFMLLFAIGNEVYIRLTYLPLGLKGLDFVTVNPAQVSHPLSSCRYGKSVTNLKPSSSFINAGFRYDINRDGYRSTDYPYEKPTNTFRIVMIDYCLGEGMSADYQTCFATLIEKKLNELHLGGRHFELVNLSMSGAKPGHLLYTLEHVAPKYHPDLIMFDVFPESVAVEEPVKIEPFNRKPPPASFLDVISKPEMRFFHSVFFTEFAYFGVREDVLPSQWIKGLIVKRPKSKFDKPAKVKEMMGLIDRLHGSVPVFVYVMKAVRHRSTKDLTEAAAVGAKQYGFGFVDCCAESYGPLEKVVAWPGDQHLGPKGHALITNWLMKPLVPFINDIIRKQDEAKQAKEESPSIKTGNK